jgi:hypothetical protein
MRKRQLAAAEDDPQGTPSATRLVEMKGVSELVVTSSAIGIVRVEDVILDGRMCERNDAVRGNRRRAPIEDVSLIDDDQADLAARRRSIDA